VYQPHGWRLGATRPESPRRGGRLALLILLGGLAFLYSGGDLLRRHFSDEPLRSHRALAGWMLVAAALLQLRIALSGWRRRESIELARFGWRSSYWRWLLLGPIVCYLAMALWGVDRHGRYLFRAAVGLWYTLMLLPIIAPELWEGGWCAWARLTPVRRLARTTFAVLLIGVSAELGLRAYSALSGDSLDAMVVAQQCLLTPGSDRCGRRVNHLGYWDDEFHSDRAAARRRAGGGDRRRGDALGHARVELSYAHRARAARRGDLQFRPAALRAARSSRAKCWPFSPTWW
jgi:hypothetical protein